MKKKQNKWEDHYSIRARKEGYPARSVYKLMEIQQKFRIIKKGNRVLDLGCSPGSWLMYATQLVEKSGKVTGLDIKKIKNLSSFQAEIIQADVNDLDNILTLIGDSYNVILSDMAPETIGRQDLDAYRSFELSNSALNIANRVLKKGGNFVCKNFFGGDSKDFFANVKNNFQKQKLFKPKCCRKGSNEIFVIGLGKK